MWAGKYYGLLTEVLRNESGCKASTKCGWIVDNAAAWQDLHSRAFMAPFISETFGYGMIQRGKVTIVTRLRVSNAAKQAGVTDSDLSLPVVWTCGRFWQIDSDSPTVRKSKLSKL